MRELGVAGLDAYRDHLEAHADEWRALEELCRVTISRFYRDRDVWDHLVADVLPRCAAAADEQRRSADVWSAGCGAGEEPYTMAIAWRLAIEPRWPSVPLRVLATDLDAHQLRRASAAVYPAGALRELPPAWRAAAFDEVGGEATLRPAYRAAVTFARRDVRAAVLGGPFDVVLCRNLAFTYLAEDVQREVLAAFRAALRPGGALMIGMHEQLPGGGHGWRAVHRSIYVPESGAS
jgi:chemotaxis protein methyltransferase CheR